MIPSSESSKILIITAHPDDELLSCGGLIYQESQIHQIDVCVVTHKGERWQRNFFSVCEKLGVHRAVSLDIPLWEKQKAKVLNFFSRDEFMSALFCEYNEPELFGFDLYITHGLDGDIDQHPHHKYLATMVKEFFPNRNLWHFLAFPRLGTGPHHPLYDLHQSLKWQEPFFRHGFLSPDLAEKVDKAYGLEQRTIEKKRELKSIYMKNKENDYRMINYPVEMFTKNRRLK